MSNRQSTDVRVIHPSALADWGAPTCFAALEVARDLRSGAIPPEEYDQGSFIRSHRTCGSACCIAGHIAFRMKEPVENLLERSGYWGPRGHAYRLFAGSRPSDPLLAADAIERFILDGSDDPWVAP